MGAWPVVGFMGLDVLALYIAFRVSFRSADAYETVELTALELVFAKVTARGQREVWRFNPSWVRLEQETHEEFGTERVALSRAAKASKSALFSAPSKRPRSRATWPARWPTPAAARASNKIPAGRLAQFRSDGLSFQMHDCERFVRTESR